MQFIPGTMGRVPAMLDTYYRAKPGALAPATLCSRRQVVLHAVLNEVLAYSQKSHDRTLMRPYVDDAAISAEYEAAERILYEVPTLHPREVGGDFEQYVTDLAWKALKDAKHPQARV